MRSVVGNRREEAGRRGMSTELRGGVGSRIRFISEFMDLEKECDRVNKEE